MIRYYQNNLPKEQATSKIHSGGLTPSYQGAIIGILPQEYVSTICLLLKNRTPKKQFEILKDKIQSLYEEAQEMSVRFNSPTVSQTSLISIPNPSVTNRPIKPNISTPEEMEEMSLEEMSLEEMEEYLDGLKKENEELREIEIQQQKENR